MGCVIIYVPYDIGPTKLASDLATHYGKRLILYDWKPGAPMPDDALILTNDEVDGAIDIDQAVWAIWRVRAHSTLTEIGTVAESQGQTTAGSVFLEFLYERSLQDEQHGGAQHDDTHAPMDWINLVDYQLDKLASEGGDDSSIPDTALIRARLVKIGALAIAGIRSIDRLARAEAVA